MSKKRTGRIIDGTFIPILKSIWNESPAWKAMSPWARLVYQELRGLMANDASNNGRIYRSVRKVAQNIGCSKERAAEAFPELEHYGFIVETTGAHLGTDGKGKSAHWRLTESPYWADGERQPATRDYEHWNGKIFKRRTRSNRFKAASRKTESCPERTDTSVRSAQTKCPERTDTFGRNSRRKCPERTDISISSSTSEARRADSTEPREGSAGGAGNGHVRGSQATVPDEPADDWGSDEIVLPNFLKRKENGSAGTVYTIVERAGRYAVMGNGVWVKAGFLSEGHARQWIERRQSGNRPRRWYRPDADMALNGAGMDDDLAIPQFLNGEGCGDA